MTPPTRNRSATAALLDLWDTLVWAPWPELHRQWAAYLGVPASEVTRARFSTSVLRNIGRTPDAEADVAVVLEACGLEPEKAAIGELAALEGRFVDTEARLYEDTLPGLRELRSTGLATVIVSNCSRQTRRVLDRFHLADEVDAVVLSFEVGTLKPGSEIFEAALGSVGAVPEHSVFVDDRTDYLDGATGIGLETFQIVRRPGWSDRTATGSHQVITSLWDVVSAISGSKQRPGRHL